MTIPFREWTNFDLATLEGSDAAGPARFTAIDDWTETVREYIKVGFTKDPDPWDLWYGLVRPSNAETFQLQTSLDTIVDALFQGSVGLSEDPISWTFLYLNLWTTTDRNTWVPRLVNGKYYDGENEWQTYPIGPQFADNEFIADSGFPKTLELWMNSSEGGVVIANARKLNFFRNGFYLTAGYPAPPDAADAAEFSVLPLKIKTRYFNAVVNSMSRYYSPTAGGVEIILTGLGFENSEVELNENRTGGGIVYADGVDFIYLEGLQGQGTYTLTGGNIDFTVDSNTQITIKVGRLPAMDVGTYDIKLRKDTVGGGIGDVDSYAGDFRCDDSGRIRPGIRMTLLVSDTFLEEEKSQPLLLMKWRFKDFADCITYKNWSFIDVAAPDTFYEGRILDVSSFRRGVNEDKGSFNVSDMTVVVSNADNELSMLLAENFPKNQIADLFFHWGNRPHSRRIYMCRCMVDDISEDGPRVKLELKDITRKYFAVKIPKYICTEDEYANILVAAKGAAMPEILGLCSVTDADAPGANDAVCINTTTYTYLAARRILHDITEVYSDAVAKTGGGVDYEIYYRDGGRTYIEFTGDQGTNRITFNSEGYFWPDWDSANGYVQNPAYIIAFLLTFLAEIPYEFLDVDSFDALATIFEDADDDESGHFNPQTQFTFDKVLSEMLFAYGPRGFPDKDGRFKVEIKSLTEYEDATLRLFDQIDLMSPASKKGNLKNAVNLANAKYDYHPAAGKFYESLSDDRPSSIEAFEAELDGGGILEFPWTNSEGLVQERITDILDRRSFGERTISFSISIHHIEDIDIFTDFRFQDPFGLSAEGAGEAERYCYITSLNYNWKQGTIDIEAIDLSWLLRTYFILGDDEALEAAWLDADVADRMFAYLCVDSTGKFSDGFDGKRL